ncbi:flagellar brake protein [Anaerosporobacter faecicola]|uniref:flagellar brake protein n=1 Tax=Anaerosporobacter faecicola TaxID=2718714 RepID=UPI00143CB7A4|nr:flagellar brake domain-containing protein [Anaerosporobacter faecicola]
MPDISMLTIGDKISLIKVNDKVLSDGNEEVFPSKLIEIASDRSIIITNPIYKNRLVNLDETAEYILTFYSNKDIYRSRGYVIRRFTDDTIKLAEISIVNELRHYQRRNYYRLSCIIDGDYRVVTPMEEWIEKKLHNASSHYDEISALCRHGLSQLKTNNHKATITDLSGGGIRFHSQERHNVKDRINFSFIIYSGNRECLIDVNLIIIDAVCVRTKPVNYEYRAVYEHITTETREKIVQYVFEVQRAKRRRDKGND